MAADWKCICIEEVPAYYRKHAQRGDHAKAIDGKMFGGIAASIRLDGAWGKEDVGGGQTNAGGSHSR